MNRPGWLRKIAQEEGTAVFQVTFKDHSVPPELVTPASATYSLLSTSGYPIIYREAISPLASVVYVVISGDNMRILDDEKDDSTAVRIFLLEYTYNSDVGSGLPAKKAARFEIENLKLIGQPLEIDIAEMVFTSDDHTVSIS